MGTSHTSPGKPNYCGLDLEKTSRLRSRQNFFLDIPFDRTHCGRICGQGQHWPFVASSVDVLWSVFPPASRGRSAQYLGIGRGDRI